MTLRNLVLCAAACAALLTLAKIDLNSSSEARATASAGLGYISPDSPVAASRLDAAIAPLFDDENLAETRAVIVMHNGRIIAERYAPGYSEKTRFISWSMAKTVTSVLVGLMVSDGRLVLDDPAPVPAWQRAGDAHGDITLRQLLHMSSGIAHVEAGSPPYESDEVRMLFLDGRANMAGYAEVQPMSDAAPGTRFNYSSNTSVILSDIMTRALTDSKDPDVRRDALLEFMQGRLLEPVGITSMVPEFDASGTMIGGSIMHATARDWAKFGEFLRTKGSVKGSQIVSRRYMDFMATPSRQNASYGGHVWLNRRGPDPDDQVLFPDRAPQSVMACLGHLGQFIVVSPEQGLTVVRLGMTPDHRGSPLHRQMGEIFALFPVR